MMQMNFFPKAYDPSFEEKCYEEREKNGCFKPNATYKKAKQQVVGQVPFSDKFTSSMALPNVTGVLHLGHALSFTTEDVMHRYARMCGKQTLRIPGTDHAGISTQVVVEKKLAKEKNLTRHDVGRPVFMNMLRNHVKESRATIVGQLKKLGCSCDWGREQFTLSEKLSRAVRKSFSNLAHENVIYQANYIINRCPRCQTVLSDLEVLNEEVQATLYYIRYFLSSNSSSNENKEKEYILVATGRPETMFGDVAIAIHPTSQWKKYVGKYVKIPFSNKEIPVIVDETIDPEFGTGALKITPVHDPIDFELGQKHGLALDVFAFDKDLIRTQNAGERVGKNIEKHFAELIERLQTDGYLEKTETYQTTRPICERCATRVQPLISKQRFVNVQPYAQKAKEAVQKGETVIIPSRFEKILFDRADKIKPRCISRQLRWGHRIPVWHCMDCGHGNVFDEDRVLGEHEKQEGRKEIILSQIVFNLIADSKVCEVFTPQDVYNLLMETSLTPQYGRVGDVYVTIYKEKYKTIPFCMEEIKEIEKVLTIQSEDEAVKYLKKLLTECPNVQQKSDTTFCYVFKCSKCGSTKLKQDEDVLDTRFSSALRPFAILGRPEQTQDMEDFYPNTMLRTGRDIIFFRVMRMMMMGAANTGKMPFKYVYLNGLVTDEKGQKMSKSRGNGVDPLDLIKDYGTDAMRVGLMIGVTPGNDLKFSFTKVDYAKRFLNKVWNASRYVALKLENETRKADYTNIRNEIINRYEECNEIDKWILAKIDNLILQGDKYIQNFMYGEFAQEIINTVWHDICDWYIEISKHMVSPITNKILLYVLVTSWKLLHPYAPFITENLWKIFGFDGYIMVRERPSPLGQEIKNTQQKKQTEEAKKTMQLIINIITAIRNLRQTSNIQPKQTVEVCIEATKEECEMLHVHKELIKNMTNAEEIKLYNQEEINSQKIPTDYKITLVETIKIGIKTHAKVDRNATIQKLGEEYKKVANHVANLEKILHDKVFLAKAPEKIIEERRLSLGQAKEKMEKLQQEIETLCKEHSIDFPIIS